jgi:hypothetical protein
MDIIVWVHIDASIGVGVPDGDSQYLPKYSPT